jgi:hypothetical protein
MPSGAALHCFMLAHNISQNLLCLIFINPTHDKIKMICDTKHHNHMATAPHLSNETHGVSISSIHALKSGLLHI